MCFMFCEFQCLSFIFISYIVLLSCEDEKDWLSIPIPLQSYFSGFDPPTNVTLWKESCNNALEGNQILLRKVINQIRYPGEVLSGDIHFGWLHRMGDVFLTKNNLTLINNQLSKLHTIRSPISLFSYSYFEGKNFQGKSRRDAVQVLWPNEIVSSIVNMNYTFPRKIIGIGFMDENWGWLSTHILNRTCTWSFGITSDCRHSSVSQLEQMRPLLDDPNLVMLLVNQHHNVSHPKVISLPRGVLREHSKMIWDEALKILKSKLRKSLFVTSISSHYRHRPSLLSCLIDRLGEKNINLHMSRTHEARMHVETYVKNLLSSRAVLCLPGLGYDCWRIWESLLSGSMAVLEKGTGLDRSLYRLPALLLDDFADATPALLRQAYVEALYRADEWDYTRITERHWQRILYEASKNGNIDYMLRLHPMEAEDASFTRPLIPFDCEAMGGCGLGTKRVPKKSCSIDPKVDMKTYDWEWYEKRNKTLDP